MTRQVQVNGKIVSLDARIENGDLRFRWQGGEERTASLVEIAPRTYSVLLDGHSYEARVTAEGIAVGFTTIAATVADPREAGMQGASSSTEAQVAITSLMPGKVIRVLVSEGEEVEAGQGVVVIEAMKMQNELKSRKSGVVLSVRTREGATVIAGEILAVVE